MGSIGATELIIFLLVLVVLFFVLRELLLWYWKVNQVVALLTEIRDLLRSGATPMGSPVAASPSTRNGTTEAEGRGRVGIVLDSKVAETVEAGGPTDRAGVKVGDEILKANGKSLTGSASQDTRLLAGAPGTKLVLTVKRAGHVTDIEVTRAGPVEAS